MLRVHTVSLVLCLGLAACHAKSIGAGGQGGGGGSVCADPGGCEYPSKGFVVDPYDMPTAVDALTGRTLPLLARVPQAAGPLPVVIWSHGGGFLANGDQQAAAWGAALSEQGYVVIHVAHVPPAPSEAQVFCDLAAIDPADCVLDPSADEDATGLLALVKTRDVVSVLDALPELSSASEQQGGPALDLTGVAVAGWSAGARAPMVVMGATFEPLPGQPPLSLEDPRVAAAVALSPVGPGFGGFFDDGTTSSWAAGRGPILFATGENDVKPTKPELDGPTRRKAFDLQPADGARWLLYSTLPVGVGGHPTFDLEDTASTDEPVVRLSVALSSTVRAFLDASLLGEAEAEAWLASDNAALLAGDATWENR